jgi:hypothetical protein
MSEKKHERATAGGNRPEAAPFKPDFVAAAKASPTFRPYVDTYLKGGGDPKLLDRFRPGKNPTWAEKQRFLKGYLAGGGSMVGLLGLRGKQAQVEREIEEHIDQQREGWEINARQHGSARRQGQA